MGVSVPGLVSRETGPSRHTPQEGSVNLLQTNCCQPPFCCSFQENHYFWFLDFQASVPYSGVNPKAWESVEPRVSLSPLLQRTGSSSQCELRD